MKKVLFLILGFYILTLLQISFFIHFVIFQWIDKFNLILIAVILINLFENRQKNLGFLGAVVGGFFLDIFSQNFIGFWILILLGVSLFIKMILKKYLHPVIKLSAPFHGLIS